MTTQGRLPVGVTGKYLATYVTQDNEGVDVHRELVSIAGEQSTDNTTTTALGSGETYTGTWEKNDYPDVMVSCQTDNGGTLYFDFSVDGTNVSTFPVAGFSVSSGIHEFHTAVKGSRYFRARLVNDSGAQSYLRLYTYYGAFAKAPNAPLNQSISDDSDAALVKAVLVGKSEGGTYSNVGISSLGKVGVDVPLTAFGELSVAELTPQVQIKFPSHLNQTIVQSLTNKAGSSVSVSTGLCSVVAAGTAQSYGQIRSRDVVRYGPGQGLRAKFTASFTTGVANSTQWAGPGDDDEMIGFGYNGTEFSVLHRRFGELEVKSLTFTAGGDADGGTFTLTIDGTAVTITVPAGSATIADVCALVVAASADIFNAGRGWQVFTLDSKTVFFVSLVAENAQGAFSFADVNSGVTAGSFTTVLTGVAPTETKVAQSNWNIDVMDGTGVSGMTLDPTKINVFDIALQYLGAGNIFCSIENPATGRLEPVHMFQFAGALTVPTFRNPTFHLNLIAKTETGYTGGALTMKTSSLGGFIEGREADFGIRESASATVSTNGTTEVVNLVVANQAVSNGTRNKIESYIDHLTIINEATKAIQVDIYRNPTKLNSGVTLASVDTDSVMVAGAGTGTRTGGQKLVTFNVAASLSKDIDVSALDLKIRPTERLAFVVTKQSGGADGAVTVGVSWLERV